MVVAQQIIKDAGRANLSAGDLLPSEWAMLEQYGIGRGTLREALCLLEFQVVIELRPGLGGGATRQSAGQGRNSGEEFLPCLIVALRFSR